VPVVVVVSEVNANYLLAPDIDLSEFLGYSSLADGGGNRIDAAFKNVGNTCYLNALLHCLAQLASVQAWSYQHEQRCISADVADLRGSRSGCVLCHLAWDVRDLATLPPQTFASDVRDLATAAIPKVALFRRSWSQGKFHNRDQQCAAEAFRLLMEACNDVDEERAQRLGVAFNLGENTTFSTPMWWAFGGVQQSSIACRACGRSSIKYEMCSHVALAVSGENSTIERLLASHWEPEALIDEDDCCTFEGCGVYWRRTKTTRMSRWPRVLVLHLKRWHQVFHQGPYCKLDTRVDFRESLHVDEAGTLYDLKAVIVHSGDAHGGHYTSYVRAFEQRWFFCDDGRKPREVSSYEAMNSQAYMLFYEKRI